VGGQWTEPMENPLDTLRKRDMGKEGQKAGGKHGEVERRDNPCAQQGKGHGRGKLVLPKDTPTLQGAKVDGQQVTQGANTAG
jgi:hypothetical protein